MSLRYIVPTLGLVAFTTAPAMAADVGGLSVAGYVDSILAFEDGGDAVAGEDASIDFSAFAQLEIGYQVGDAVSANIELSYDEDGFDAANMEQAYIAWAINEQVTITMGKFHNFIGWEGLDAPDLYRVNNSYMYAGGTFAGNIIGASFGSLPIWGDDVTGVTAKVDASEQIEFGIGIVDYIWGGDTGLTGLRTTDQISFMAYATYTAEGLGYFDLDIGLGPEESINDTGEAGDIFQIDINGEIDTLREDNGLLFAFDINYTDYDVAGSLGILLLANYALPTEVPMSATLSLNYFDPVDDDDVAEDDEGTEIAVALLTNPTDDENFSLNVEIRSISRSADDSDEFGVYLEMLAVIP